jgi:hypothetical protein
MAERTFGVELRRVKRNNTGRLLPAMLEGMETESRMCGGIFVSEYAEYTAFFVKMIGIKRIGNRTREARVGLTGHVA